MSESYPPKTLSQEEISLLVKGAKDNPDEIYELILFYLNRLVEAHQNTHITLNDHQQREEEMMAKIEEIGGVEQIIIRAEYVDSLIKKNNMRTAMMEKVSQSTLTWVLIAFLGFLATATWHEIVASVKRLLVAH